jgi:hypothetical protein
MRYSRRIYGRRRIARYDVEESPQLVVPSVEANEPTVTAPDEGPYDELPVIFDETSHHTSES